MNRAERSSAEVDAASRRPPTNQPMARGTPRSRPKGAFNGVKVFSATVLAERAHHGDRVTQWRAEHPDLEIVDMVVTQSSDAAFHCLTVSVFYWAASALQRAAAP